MLSIYESGIFAKRKYGKFPAVSIPENLSEKSKRFIQAYIAQFKEKIAADSQVVEKEHLDKG